MAERITKHFVPFQKGQKVYLEGRNLKLRYANRKLAPKREGPFVITEVLNPLNYRLDLPRHWNIHPVFHASLLVPYHETDTHGPNHPRPPPDLIDGEEEYEIEAILQLQFRNRRWRYLVKWKGYEEFQWIPANEMHHAQDIVDEFHRDHPDVARPEFLNWMRLSPATFDSLPFRRPPPPMSAADANTNWRTRPSGRRALEGG